eukprot:7401601-Heterocapsa_arctica.AAC.1
MAMDLELFGVLETETLQLPGALNVTADWLSRIYAPDGPPGQKPSALTYAKERACPSRGPGFFHLPTPGDCRTLWGAGTGVALQAWPAHNIHYIPDLGGAIQQGTPSWAQQFRRLGPRGRRPRSSPCLP